MSKSFNCLLVLLLFCSSAVKSQNYLEVQILDSLNKTPIIGAILVQDESSNGGVSDAMGLARCKVDKTGLVSFHIRVIGYHTAQLLLNIPQEIKPLIIYLSEENNELFEIIVSSGRTQSRIEDLPTRIEVLGLAEVSEENGIKPGNIVSLLGDIAGIQLQQTSASSGNTVARIQGLNGRYTQILRDGIPVYGGLSGNFGLMQIPPSDLKQIEIIKGSASTLYGGDAIGGIINLISKEAEYTPEIKLTYNQSTLNETNANAYLSRRINKVGYSLFSSGTLQQAVDVNKDGMSDVAAINHLLVHPRFAFYLSSKSKLIVNFTLGSEKREGGDMRYLTFNRNDTLFHVDNYSNRIQSDLLYTYAPRKNRQLTAKASILKFNQSTQTKFYHFDAGQLLFYSELSYLLKGDKSTSVFGLNLQADQVDNQTQSIQSISNYQYQTIGAFIQNTYPLSDKLILESGLRMDYHSNFGQFVLPRLSLLYKIHPNLSARINGGTGYKAPTPLSYVNQETDLLRLQNNSTLKAEHSMGMNADINYYRQFANGLSITLNQSFFQTNLQAPIIDSSSHNGNLFLYQATKDLLSRGCQSYLRVHGKEFEFYFSYVHTSISRTFDPEHPQPMLTPKNNFSSTFFFEPLKALEIGLEASYIAGQLDQKYQPVANYLLLAAMIRFTYKKLTFVLNGENLSDFRQNKNKAIFDGNLNNPVFHQLWAPIDGRVINLSVQWKLM